GGKCPWPWGRSYALRGKYPGKRPLPFGAFGRPMRLDFPEEAKVAKGITRRDFNTRMGAATAGAVLLGNASTALGASRILGANDRVVTASVGIRGQGNSLKRGFARLKNVDIKLLCDPDANLAAERINDERLKDVATFRPAFVQDLRR